MDMDISVFGYKFKLNIGILILIGIIYLILVSHTLCGCCNHSLIESFEMLSKYDAFGNNSSNNNSSNNNSSNNNSSNNNSSNNNSSNNNSSNNNSSMNSLMKAKMMQNIIGSGGGGSKSTGKEGFSGASINDGQSSPYDLTSNSQINTSAWSTPDMTVTPGQPLSKGVTDFLNRPAQQLPLPEGEMLLFANTPFKPECCPNTYSTSSGCACMSSNTYNYLKQRSGNNVPYSEY